MSTRYYKQVQGISHSTFNLYEVLQEAVKREAGVTCSIVVKPHLVSVRTKDYVEFVLARQVIRKRVSVSVIRDKEEA